MTRRARTEVVNVFEHVRSKLADLEKETHDELARVEGFGVGFAHYVRGACTSMLLARRDLTSLIVLIPAPPRSPDEPEEALPW